MASVKKKKKVPWVLILILTLMLGLGIGVGIFFTQNTLVEGRIIPVNIESLDLRNTGVADLHGLRRCTKLKDLDLRGNDIDAAVLAELQKALPDCRILYDVTVGGERYDILTTELALPDLPEDWENIKKLTALTSLRVDKCTNPAAMAELREALPGCAMTWTLGVGGQWFDVNSAALDITGSAVYFEELLSQLQWFPAVKKVTLMEPVLTPDQQRTLMADFPDIAFTWPVQVGDTALPCDTSELVFGPGKEMDLEALGQVMDLLPDLRSLDLTDSDVSGPDRAAFRKDHPDIDVSWDVTLFDEVYPCDTQMLDFNEKAFTQEELQELDQAIAMFPELAQVDMCDTGLTNEELDALNRKYENVKVVWKVSFSRDRYTLRTDATYFRPSEYGANPPSVSDEDAAILSYCTDMEALDLGHQYFSDLTFLENMPHLKYLIIAECPVKDLTPLSSLKELVYLECFNCFGVKDFSPLIGCTNLKALNVCYTSVSHQNAMDTFLQMPQLEYLWYCGGNLNQRDIDKLQANAETELVTFTISGGESSGGQWRYNDYYRAMRDAMNAWYMPSGTNGVDKETGGQIIIDDKGRKFILEDYRGEYYWWTVDKYAGMNPYIQGVTG